MRLVVRRMSVVAAAALVILTGCGGSDDGAQTAGSASSASGSAGSASGSASSRSQRPSPSASAAESGGDRGGRPVEPQDDAVRIDVRIENGEVTPSGERVDVEVGQTIRLVVDSDAADEIHVHSTPEHTFSFRAGTEDREFVFRLSQPGVVEAELHELGDVVVTLAARP